MNRVAAKFVPKLLSPEQKDLRHDVAQDLVDTANTDPGFLNTVITRDESWVYGYDPETKRQSSQWKHPESPRPKKARQVRSKIKVMLTVFFDVRGIVHHKYAPEGQTVTKEYYHDVLRRLRDAVRRKRPDMWTANNWHLHHDNAPAHSSQLIHTFLAKHGITTVLQPPYSPDLAPCDFWLFPKLKTPLKGSRFESREEIMHNAMTELNTIPKEDFQRCFRQWKDRCEAMYEYYGMLIKQYNRIPIYICNNIFLFQYQKMAHLFEHYSELEGVPQNQILLMLNDVQIYPHDTPDSLKLTVASVVEGGVMSYVDTKTTSNTEEPALSEDEIELKFQRKGCKEPFALRIRKTNKMRVLMLKCAEHLEVPIEKLKFSFDGESLNANDTPEDLDLEGGECIDLYVCD
ncbi:hypothetical protein ANN_12311 [Periplaneta americana]|uniref:Ubiquitin-like domain-containing protein n=1 Tax=Periplaneta americana TaxID=6978 RepID=A0ABQ8TGC5_PERAM|nr:hypothetical protein ANN_12311 [Periplaneta americana]